MSIQRLIIDESEQRGNTEVSTAYVRAQGEEREDGGKVLLNVTLCAR